MATDFEFMMPDSSMKHIYIQPTTCEMVLRPKEICTRCEVEVSDKPFKSAAAVKPSTSNVPPPKTTDSTTNGKKK